MIQPNDVHATLSRSILADGLPMVLDLEASRGSDLVDARDGRHYLDLFTCFASSALGFNHPALANPLAVEELGRTAINKPSNSDLYTVAMARFVDTFVRVLGDPRLPHLFFIEGGTLAVENALKVAFDYKSRRNEAAGLPEGLGTKILHLTDAFHGRSGYSLSLTNTDPVKTARFPTFGWPRISSPYAGTHPDGTRRDVAALEDAAVAQAEAAFAVHGPDIAAFIAEPIQGEGGDHHLSAGFLHRMQELVHANDALFILDEVQTGVGMTGTAWTYSQLGLEPDVVAFGKKTQVCGIMAGGLIDQIDDHVFGVSSRINSTWGGNLVDMVRARMILEVIEADHLIEQAAATGAWLLDRLDELAARHPAITDVRGRGLMCAFSLPDTPTRDRFIAGLAERGILVLGCGRRSVRFRPALTITPAELDRALVAADQVLAAATA